MAIILPLAVAIAALARACSLPTEAVVRDIAEDICDAVVADRVGRREGDRH